MEIDRNGLEVLDRNECLRLLRDAHLGRVGVTTGALPAVLPVNFWLDGEQIVILTGDGSKLDAAVQNAVVAFEVDDFDPTYHAGWSVLVTGIAREITDPRELHELGRMPVTRWAPRGGGRMIAISTEMITGRRITPGSRHPMNATTATNDHTEPVQE